MKSITFPGFSMTVKNTSLGYTAKFKIESFEGALSYFSSQFYLNRSGNEWSDVQNMPKNQRFILGEISFQNIDCLRDFLKYMASNYFYMDLVDEESSLILYQDALDAI